MIEGISSIFKNGRHGQTSLSMAPCPITHENLCNLRNLWIKDIIINENKIR